MAAVDEFTEYLVSLISPIERSVTVTPNDSADLTNVTRALLVDVAGAVKVTYLDGTTDDSYLAAGVWHAMRAVRVWSTGTDATGIHAGY